MEAITLTDKQNEVLRFIRVFKKNKGYPPTRQEIADDFNINVSGVQQHMSALVKKGRIKIAPKISRGIEILRDD